MARSNIPDCAARPTMIMLLPVKLIIDVAWRSAVALLMSVMGRTIPLRLAIFLSILPLKNLKV